MADTVIKTDTPPGMTSFGITALTAMREARAEAVSTDGASLVYLSNASGTNQIWSQSLAGGPALRLTDLAERVSSFAFNPKSNDILIVTDTGGDERFQFLLLRAGADAPVALTAAPTVVHQWGAWSPDGSQIAYSSNARAPHLMDVHLMDVASGAVTTLLEGNGFIEAIAFTPDGSALILRDSARGMGDQDLLLLDIATRACAAIMPHDGPARYMNARLRKDGATVFLLCDQGSDFHQVQQRDLASGALVSCIAADGHDIDAYALTPDQQQAACAINIDGATQLVLSDLNGDNRIEVALPFIGCVNSLRFTPDGAALLMSLDSTTHSCDVWQYTLASGTFTQLTDAPKGGISAASLIAPVLERFTSFDGLSVPALVYRPAGTPPAKGWPVLFLVHGGPEGQWSHNWRPDVQHHLSQGVMVVAPNVRGSTGYGRSYHASDDREKRYDSVADLNAIADAIAARPDVDASRIGVQGQSYGGFMVLAALTTRPDLWKCGIDLYGISNFTTMMQTTGPWRKVLRAVEYGTDAALLDSLSPIHKMDQIRAPLLLVHCHEDPRVAMEQSEQVYSTLRGLGKPVEILRVAAEGHGFARRENRIHAFSTIAAFVQRNL
ncbi:alpha/beta hydrolase family protein [Ketogulonicigenium vulgare]|uniref:Peptidase S9 prolyl oligopeptidase active site domain protein n=1 Tax=Ketogulonicigenium vulgare (strain WSH-001) TaxID=759362 RepID=F9YBP6_KETVW|nr:S9 family peptidase [Ketogulonicigenium vulgare]AEM42798.1 peptidase S9 prolyl oligopeptidase active site domain protein [Ketogulonicigenium vulgare WSH-001]ALJ82769.1 hypothetical protein KVH_15775 [Ketogulonicigenium vulgare]